MANKEITIIVAIANNWAIGLDNKLLWHISDDLKRFKKLTMGHCVIMGKKTFDSLPVKPLPGRRNIVLSDDPADHIPGCEMAYSIDEALLLADPDKESFVIGGGTVYRQFLPIASRLYITHVHKDFEADTFFPEIDPRLWKCVSREPVTDDPGNDFTYEYCIYERISQQL